MTDILDAAFIGDNERLYPPAHNLKATAGTLGATRLQRIALDLESCARAGICIDIQSLVDELKDVYLLTRQTLSNWQDRQKSEPDDDNPTTR